MRKLIAVISFLIVTGCASQPFNTGNSPSPQPTSTVTIQPTVTPQPTTLPSATNLPSPSSTPVIQVSAGSSSSPIPLTFDDATQLDISQSSGYIEPLIAMNPDGNFVFANTKTRFGETTYNSNGESSTSFYNDAYAKTFNNLGNPLINEFKIKENFKVYDVGMNNDGKPFITVDSNNIITVAWTSKIAPTLDKPNIFIRKYNNDLVLLNNEVLINPIDSDTYIMYIYTDKNDDFYIIFGGKKAYLKKYDTNGILIK